MAVGAIDPSVPRLVTWLRLCGQEGNTSMKLMRRTGPAVLVAAVALSASIAVGAVGDLAYVTETPQGMPISSAGFRAKKAADPAAIGLVHPRAMVAPSDALVQVAFDAADPKAETLDLIRIDRTGKGNFKNAETIKLKVVSPARSTYHIARSEPRAIEVTKDGRKLPVLVFGTYYKNKATEFGNIGIQLAAEGECKFGDTVRKVCVVDVNRNFTVGDVTTRKVGTREYKSADMCMIADENGKFPTARTASARMGQPLQVNGKWYTLTDGDMKIAAKPFGDGVGKLSLNAPQWTCQLMADGYTMNVSGGAEPAEVPSGEYRLRSFRIVSQADAKGGQPGLYGSLNKTLTIAPGKTTSLAFGTDLTVTPTATVDKKNRKVRLAAALTDATGARITVYGKDGKRPPAPQIEVIDQAGEVVYTAKLAYG